MSAPRGLSPEERAAWARLAESVTPLPGRVPPPVKQPGPTRPGKQARPAAAKSPPAKPRPQPSPRAPAPRPRFSSELDSHWNRRLKAGRVTPDLTLDLHGHTLDTAHSRIMDGLDQARAMGARVVLVVAGRERPVDPADRMERRGAIRAKLLDWLAASRHADSVAAVRRAHIRHGGEGALYLVLKRAR
ncbi:Smr/MutS family protein [Erythrobacter sp.]|uniref:Smr/MutS family protein n=1 Tax=Erythrobacter sp. TaxID=1042 RepID=UPI001425ECC1|nr:Smr/MutS family protein [Erythrobacter sp.]QIQ87875.1 MAG: DNA mismatch repair protein MutS [Erythrobacter sp.]